MCKFVKNIFLLKGPVINWGLVQGVTPPSTPRQLGLAPAPPVTMPAREALTENGWMDDMETLIGSKGQNNKHLFAL